MTEKKTGQREIDRESERIRDREMKTAGQPASQTDRGTESGTERQRERLRDGQTVGWGDGHGRGTCIRRVHKRRVMIRTDDEDSDSLVSQFLCSQNGVRRVSGFTVCNQYHNLQ